mmetsp:Transcript_13431/g.49947  ORF Transcript_13431/g.49947 Transcript_13431/m.49947 type:complete len:296 (+) Transcript_13431:2868-3755(+)
MHGDCRAPRRQCDGRLLAPGSYQRRPVQAVLFRICQRRDVRQPKAHHPLLPPKESWRRGCVARADLHGRHEVKLPIHHLVNPRVGDWRNLEGRVSRLQIPRLRAHPRCASPRSWSLASDRLRIPTAEKGVHPAHRSPHRAFKLWMRPRLGRLRRFRGILRWMLVPHQIVVHQQALELEPQRWAGAQVHVDLLCPELLRLEALLAPPMLLPERQGPLRIGAGSLRQPRYRRVVEIQSLLLAGRSVRMKDVRVGRGVDSSAREGLRTSVAIGAGRDVRAVLAAVISLEHLLPGLRTK